MRKIKAMIQILFADKWAVFTYEDAPENSEWQTAPTFRWNISHKSREFFRIIKDRLHSVETYNTLEE